MTPTLASHQDIFSGAPISFVGRDNIRTPLKTSKKPALEATLPLVSPRSDVCEMRTTLISVVLPIVVANFPHRSTTQILVVTHHQYGISVRISQASFREESSADVVKCLLLSQATCT